MLDMLPVDVLVCILLETNRIQDVLAVGAVSKALHDATNHNVLWHHLYRQRFPVDVELDDMLASLKVSSKQLFITRLQSWVQIFVPKFNTSETHEEQALALRRIVEERGEPTTSESMTRFLVSHANLIDSDALKRFLLHASFETTLQYVGQLDFCERTIDDGLRVVWNTVGFPSSSKRIFDISGAFATKYAADNSEGLYTDPDDAFTISATLLFLNTSLHSPNIASKITEKTFVSAISGSQGSAPAVPVSEAKRLYASMKQNPLVTLPSPVLSTQPPSQQQLTSRPSLLQAAWQTIQKPFAN